MWASVLYYSETEVLITVYNDFLNEILKSTTHLHFFYLTKLIITKIIFGDTYHQGYQV
jgi:hypothetical protein